MAHNHILTCTQKKTTVLLLVWDRRAQTAVCLLWAETGRQTKGVFIHVFQWDNISVLSIIYDSRSRSRTELSWIELLSWIKLNWIHRNWNGTKKTDNERVTGATERGTAAHLCVSASHRRTQMLGQRRQKERRGKISPPPVIFPQTQRAFDSFVWTHTFMSNCCFSFLVYPTRRTCIMQDRQRIWHRYSSKTTLNSRSQGQLFPLHAEQQARAWGPTSVILSRWRSTWP